MTGLARRRLLALSGACLLVSFAFWAPAFRHPTASGWGDWQWFHHMWEAGRIAIVRWHEAPLFDPHHCGGVPLWGNPQTQAFSPTFLMTAVPFGTTIGHKLFIVFHCLVGLVGTYVFVRRELRSGELASAYAAVLFTTSGYFAWHGAGGHATFLAFYYGPLLLVCWRRCARDLRYSAAVAGLMVLTVLEGGHYPFPYFVLWLTFDLVLRLWDRGRPQMLLGAVVAGVLTGLMGCWRFIPILIAISAHPHPVPDTDSLRLDEILHVLTVRDQGIPLVGHIWMFPEYGAYVGWAAILLGAIGIALSIADSFGLRPRRKRSELAIMLVGLVLFILLTQGNASPLHPWPLLQNLPFYRSIHVPSRWRLYIVFYLALFCAVAIDALERRTRSLDLRRPWHRVLASLPVLVLLGMMGDVWSVTWPIVDRWDGPVIAARAPEERFQLVTGRVYLQDYANYPSENVGTRECYDPVPWDISPMLWLGDELPARIFPPDAGEVIDAGRTSLTMWAEVELDRPARVVFNQNYFPDFDFDEGVAVEDHGRLAIDLASAGTHRVSARYRPHDLPYVVTISVLGSLLALWVATRSRFRRRRV
jgi:hypothetical protein